MTLNSRRSYPFCQEIPIVFMQTQMVSGIIQLNTTITTGSFSLPLFAYTSKSLGIIKLILSDGCSWRLPKDMETLRS